MADRYADLTHEAADIDQAIDRIANHVQDSTSHVTETERQNWNGKADEADLLSLQTVVEAKQDALTFGTQTVRESTDSLTSGAIWNSILAQMFGLNTYTNLAAGDDLNDFTTVGIYRCTNSTTASQILNMPSPIAQQAGGRLIVFNIGGSGRYIQIYISSGARFWMRSNLSTGAWQSWYEYAGAEVAPTASTNSSNSETS